MKYEPFTTPPDPWTRAVWENDRVEILLLPVLVWFVGLFQRDGALSVLALMAWAVAFGIWCLWTMWRVTDRFPADDNWRAVATLVYGGAAWLLLPAISFLPEALRRVIAFPFVFAPGAWALIAARRPRLPPLRRGRRAILLAGAALVSLAWVVVFAAAAWLRRRSPAVAPAFPSWLAIPVIPLGLFLATMLARSAARGFTPKRQPTAESLLSETSSS